MKKYLPIIGAIFLFSFYLITQVLFQYEDGSAQPDSTLKKKYAHYQSIYNKTTVITSKGEKFKLKDIKAPVVIVNFWASWCTPCLEEFPSLVKLKSQFPDSQLKVLAVNADENQQMKKIKKISSKFDFNFPVVIDKHGRLLESFKVSSIPVSIIFRKGKVVEYSDGSKDFSSEETISKIKSWIK